jgi:hypothetical protein
MGFIWGVALQHYQRVHLHRDPDRLWDDTPLPAGSPDRGRERVQGQGGVCIEGGGGAKRVNKRNVF